jgi:hypothetical protein
MKQASGSDTLGPGFWFRMSGQKPKEACDG